MSNFCVKFNLESINLNLNFFLKQILVYTHLKRNENNSKRQNSKQKLWEFKKKFLSLKIRYIIELSLNDYNFCVTNYNLIDSFHQLILFWMNCCWKYYEVIFWFFWKWFENFFSIFIMEMKWHNIPHKNYNYFKKIE